MGRKLFIIVMTLVFSMIFSYRAFAFNEKAHVQIQLSAIEEGTPAAPYDNIEDYKYVADKFKWMKQFTNTFIEYSNYPDKNPTLGKDQLYASHFWIPDSNGGSNYLKYNDYFDFSYFSNIPIIKYLPPETKLSLYSYLTGKYKKTNETAYSQFNNFTGNALGYYALAVKEKALYEKKIDESKNKELYNIHIISCFQNLSSAMHYLSDMNSVVHVNPVPNYVLDKDGEIVLNRDHSLFEAWVDENTIDKNGFIGNYKLSYITKEEYELLNSMDLANLKYEIAMSSANNVKGYINEVTAGSSELNYRHAAEVGLIDAQKYCNLFLIKFWLEAKKLEKNSSAVVSTKERQQVDEKELVYNFLKSKKIIDVSYDVIKGSFSLLSADINSDGIKETVAYGDWVGAVAILQKTGNTYRLMYSYNQKYKKYAWVKYANNCLYIRTGDGGTGVYEELTYLVRWNGTTFKNVWSGISQKYSHGSLKGCKWEEEKISIGISGASPEILTYMVDHSEGDTPEDQREVLSKRYINTTYYEFDKRQFKFIKVRSSTKTIMDNSKVSVSAFGISKNNRIITKNNIDNYFKLSYKNFTDFYGRITRSGEFEGSSYMMFNPNITVFYIPTQSSIKIISFAFQSGWEILGTRVGMSPSQIIRILGKPSYSGYSEEDDSWTMGYKYKGFYITYWLSGKDKPVISIQITKVN